MSISCLQEGHFLTIFHVEAVIFKTKLYAPINGDSNAADIQVECGDGNGQIKFMIQKAGSTDNTLGINGWQSADHWFTANLDPESNIEAGELVWIRLEASIIRHLSFTNYRISAKRDGGKVCAGVLSGGVISDRPDGAKKSVATLVAPTALNGDLPDLPEAFAKTQINVIPTPEVEPDIPEKTAITPAVVPPPPVISLPDLPAAAESNQASENKASVLGANTQEKKKTSPILFIVIGLALFGLVVAGYFLTRGSSDPAKPSTPIPTAPPAEIKPSAPAPAPSATPPAAPPATPPSAPQMPKAPQNNAPRPSSPDASGPDLNKIVKDAINK